MVASGVTTLCHCWRFQRRDGLVLGFTDHDRDLVFGGVTYQAETGFTAAETESSLGLAVDTDEVSGAVST
ncbi:baseplate hub domain-containing protein, partial [Enterobacter cloacae]|uniref:baseplate hub domain-containing protein n=1 Tax=Enterobacter cloacae TaxID=550 RepID=UPI0034D2360E